MLIIMKGKRLKVADKLGQALIKAKLAKAVEKPAPVVVVEPVRRTYRAAAFVASPVTAAPVAEAFEPVTVTVPRTRRRKQESD